MSDNPTDLHIGFTGTRRGMSPRQKSRVFGLLQHLQPTRFHHGDCIGADDEAGLIAYQLHIPIELHPPIKEVFRAHAERGVTAGGIVRINPPKDYYKRDRAIVIATSILIATPLGNGGSRTGGTWYTVDYATGKKHDTITCYTNGNMDLSRKDLLSNPQRQRRLPLDG